MDKLMEIPEIIKALRRNMVETGSLICLGCGREHNCSTHGCAIMKEAADALEQLTRRATTENKPLTLDELRKMDGERVWTKFRGLGMYGLVAYHSDPDGDDGDDVYITNNLGGRSTYEEVLNQGGTVYAHNPKEESN